MKWFILVLGIACNASVSVLVKITLMPPRKFRSFSDPVASLINWPLWLGMVIWRSVPVGYSRLSPFPFQYIASGAYLRCNSCCGIVLGVGFSRAVALNNHRGHFAGG